VGCSAKEDSMYPGGVKCCAPGCVMIRYCKQPPNPSTVQLSASLPHGPRRALPLCLTPCAGDKTSCAHFFFFSAGTRSAARHAASRHACYSRLACSRPWRLHMSASLLGRGGGARKRGRLSSLLSGRARVSGRAAGACGAAQHIRQRQQRQAGQQAGRASGARRRARRRARVWACRCGLERARMRHLAGCARGRRRRRDKQRLRTCAICAHIRREGTAHGGGAGVGPGRERRDAARGACGSGQGHPLERARR